METFLVRLKPYDQKRRCVLRRYVFRSIHFLVGRGWSRVPKDVADHLRGVRQLAHDPFSPLAFDVCTHDEALAVDERERLASTAPRTAYDAIEVETPRPTGSSITAADIAAGGLESDDEPRASPGSPRSQRPRQTA